MLHELQRGGVADQIHKHRVEIEQVKHPLVAEIRIKRIAAGRHAVGFAARRAVQQSLTHIGGFGAGQYAGQDCSAVLVEMVEAQRLFDIRTKLIATAKDLAAKGEIVITKGKDEEMIG